MHRLPQGIIIAVVGCLLTCVMGCARHARIHPGDCLPRRGDEIVVCGQLFHTGTPVVLWTDPGGYDAYRVERRFAPLDESSWSATTQASEIAIKEPARYSLRRSVLTTQQAEQVRGGGWDLDLLREKVDQFVIHYDVAGLSRECFATLHDRRGLSVHFMLDIDGTIYQTLDVKERAWHATTSNSRSVGIEIANRGAYPSYDSPLLQPWYRKDDTGRIVLTIPENLHGGGVRTIGFIGHPARNEIVAGQIQGQMLYQYDFTPQQYDSLIRLTTTLCTVLPKITCDYPRDADGRLIPHRLLDEVLANYHGVLGHYHIQENKQDPGPAFQWDYVVDEARKLMKQ